VADEHEAFIAALERRRIIAQTVMDACNAALAVFREASVRTVPSGPRVPKRDKPSQKRQAKGPKRSKDVTPRVPTPRAESAVSMIGMAITAYLAKQELRTSDSAIIRREVAKQLGINPKKDASFSGNVGNALQQLKTRGAVTRKGTMWTLAGE
jgi:hypothetical protein